MKTRLAFIDPDWVTTCIQLWLHIVTGFTWVYQSKNFDTRYQHPCTIFCLPLICVLSISIPVKGYLFPAEQWILAHLAVEMSRESRVSRWWLKHCHQTPYFLTSMLVSCVMSRMINLPMYQVPLSLWPHLTRHNMFGVISQGLCRSMLKGKTVYHQSLIFSKFQADSTFVSL